MDENPLDPTVGSDDGSEDLSTAAHEVERLLGRLRAGDAGAYERLMEVAYDELRGVAHRQLRRLRPGDTLNTTVLVHETYLKLVDVEMSFENSEHFLSIMARAMRQVVVDAVRKRYSARRGGGQVPLSLESRDLAIPETPTWVLDLDAALIELATLEPDLVRVVDCRFFAGMTETETAKALDMSLRTVQRSWQKARAWLKTTIGEPLG